MQGVALTVAAASAGRLFDQILPWLVLLVAIVVVGGLVLYVLRRRLTGGGRGGEGFTLHELRTLHESGALSDEEFERARRALIDRVTDRTVSDSGEPPPDNGATPRG